MLFQINNNFRHSLLSFFNAFWNTIAVISPLEIADNHQREPRATGAVELLEENRWAMLLNERGQVVRFFRKPADLPEQYSLTDVVSFTRRYLNDYPVQCRIRDDGLLVVRAPKGSIWKHDIAMSVDTLLQTPFWFTGLFLLALGGVLGFAYLAVSRWLRQAQQVRDAARSGWINSVSHDIRTPLSVVMGYAAHDGTVQFLPILYVSE